METAPSGPPAHNMLHPQDCRGLAEDISRMRRIVRQDPAALMRLQCPSSCPLPHTYPLHLAVKARHIDCVRFLLAAGANPEIRDMLSGKTSLENAIQEFVSEDIIEVLVKSVVSPNCFAHDCSRTLFLELAIEKGEDNKTLKLLLENGADTEHLTTNNSIGLKRLLVNYESPVINALWAENTEAFKLLLLHGSFLECYINDKNSLPHIIIASYVEASEALEVLNIYKEFGGNLWSLQPDLKDRTDTNETALQSLRRTPCEYMFKGGLQNVDLKLEQLMGKPLTLQSLCRNSIRHAIGREYFRKVLSLPLPDQIIKFLMYLDLVYTVKKKTHV